MNGTLAQLISLTSFGNSYLNGQSVNGFYPGNSTFQYCNTVDFRTFKKPLFSKQKEVIAASDPNAWFEHMKNEGCKKLRLYYETQQPDNNAKEHQLAGFVGGGGTWLIEAVYDKSSNYWANRWEVTKQEAKDRRIWTVNYGRTLTNEQTTNQQKDISDLREQLKKTLAEISDFAFKQSSENWGKTFENALNSLNSLEPQDSFYHTDMIASDNYELMNRQLLFAAGKSYVFGGMGSWNDLWLQDENEQANYERLTSQLYELVNSSIVASINKDKNENR
jgi:hypothetical protein